MKKSLSFLLLCVAAFAYAGGNYELKQASSAGYTYKYVSGDPTQTRFYTLKNGLTVILSVNKTEPRLQTIIATKAGSNSDPATNTGLAHYLEHLLFKGTDRYGCKDWAKEKPELDKIDSLYEVYNKTTDAQRRKDVYHLIDSVSGVAAGYAIANEYDKLMAGIGAKGTNAFTSFEQTAYINDIPSNKIEQWLTVEAERFRKPVLRIFHTELEAVYEEKNIGLDSDDEKVYDSIFTSLFKKHNYGLQTTIGTVEHLKNPSLIEIRKFYNNNYVPNNMVVVMAGDFNPDQVIGQIDKHLGYMQPKPVKPYTYSPEGPITAPIEKTVYGPDAEYLNIAFRFPGANTKEALLLDLMSSILSNGTAGLMDLNLVKKQKVLEASAGSYLMKDYSILFINAKAKEGQELSEVKNLLLAEIEKLKKGEFDESLIRATVNNYKKNRIRQFESNSGRAFTLLDGFVTNVSWTSVLQQLDDMSVISKKDVMEFSAQYLGNNYVCVFKKTGEAPNVVKVEKPAITPVEVNRNDESPFVTGIKNMSSSTIAPVFVDYKKDIQQAKVKEAELLCVQNKENQLFNLYYVLEMGKNHSKLLPIAIEYLKYLGTKKQPAEAVSKAFYNLACNFSVDATNEQVYVSLDGLQENFDTGVQLFEELLTNAQPDQTALDEMISGILKKREDDKRDKIIISYYALSDFAKYGAKNPFNDVLSNEELKKLKASELTDIIHKLTGYKHYILYYGPLSLNEVKTKLAQYHRIPDKLAMPPAPTLYAVREVAENEVYFVHYPDMQQAQINWTRKATVFNADLLPQVNMFNEYFGGNMSSIVFQTIRESKALAYSTNSRFIAPAKKEDPYTIMAYVGTQADKLTEAIPAMNELLNELPKSDQLFDASKESLRNSFATSRIQKANMMFNYLTAKRRGIDYDVREKTFKALDTFSFDSLKDFHRQYYKGKPFVYTILGDRTRVKVEDLQKYGKVKELTMEEIFGY